MAEDKYSQLFKTMEAIANDARQARSHHVLDAAGLKRHHDALSEVGCEDLLPAFAQWIVDGLCGGVLERYQPYAEEVARVVKDKRGQEEALEAAEAARQHDAERLRREQEHELAVLRLQLEIAKTQTSAAAESTVRLPGD